MSGLFVLSTWHMSKLSTKQRKSESVTIFAWPEERKFPVKDCSDVPDAWGLVGKAKTDEATKSKIKARIKSRARQLGCSNLPDTAKAKMSDPEGLTLATFSVPPTGGIEMEDGSVLYTDCAIFRAGDYDFPQADGSVITGSFSEDDLQEMADNYEPVYGDLEHILDVIPPEQQGTLSALDGQLGVMPVVWVDPEDPAQLRGDISVPSWLNSALPAKDVSIVSPIEGPKRITRYTITSKARVSGSALMSEWAKFAGARHSTEDMSALQTVHDVMMGAGALCYPTPTDRQSYSYNRPHQIVHDIVSAQGAKHHPSNVSGARNYSQTNLKEKAMSKFSDWVKKWEEKGKPDDFDPEVEADPPASDSGKATFSASASGTANAGALPAEVAKRLADLEEQNKTLLSNQTVQAERARQADALMSYERLFSDGVLVPAQREKYLFNYLVRAARDASTPKPDKLMFSFKDKEGKDATTEYPSEVAAFEDFVRSFPNLGLLGEQRVAGFIPGVQMFSIPTVGGDADEQKRVHDETLEKELALRGIDPSAPKTNGNGRKEARPR